MLILYFIINQIQINMANIFASFISYISTTFFFFSILLIIFASIIDIFVTVVTLGNYYLGFSKLVKKFCQIITDGLF